MEDYVLEEYKEDFYLLLKIKDMAEHLHYKTTQQRRFSAGDPDMEIFLEEIIENADEAIIHVAKDFVDNDCDEEENKPEKLGYAFSWLKKLNNAADDDEREEFLKGWLQEILEKKNLSAESTEKID